MKTYAVVTAAGRGDRFGRDLPKQYHDLAGRSVLRRAVEPFLDHPAIAGVLVVIDPAHRGLYERATAGLPLLPPVEGGPTRQASVARGLEALASLEPTHLLVHDAARPCVSRGLIDRVLEALGHLDAVVPTLPVTDTVRRFEEDRACGEVDRAGLHRVQTPQGFAYGPLRAAHARGDLAATDDAALVLATGGELGRVEGEEANIKITLPADLARAARSLPAPPVRWSSGTGFDVHRLVPGRRLVLLGLEIPFEKGLAGHSDADVGLHAVTDAILGAIGAGDIGQHFPPSDPRWRDADSGTFARAATGLVEAAGATLEQVDVTIIGERPKIGPYRAAMRQRLAQILGIAEERANVKATTTEGLGFAGRAEGLAAQAIATVAFRR